MRAISLWQPWASLLVDGTKFHETRSWPVKVPEGGEWIAVHAAKRKMNPREMSPELQAICVRQFGEWCGHLPYGAIIGMVHLAYCVPTIEAYGPGDFSNYDDAVCGDFSEGRYAWRTDDRWKLERPIPFVGRQGFFKVSLSELELRAGRSPV